MSVRLQGGFTIIEVIIFLGITSLMVLIAVAGTSASINAVRFTDTVNTFQSSMQKEFDNTLNGVNTRTGNEICSAGPSGGSVSAFTPGTAIGTSQNCLLLGKLVHFWPLDSSQYSIYYIIGTKPAIIDTAWSDTQAIENYKLKAIASTNTETVNFPWEAQFAGGSATPRNGGSPVSANAIGFIRSPISSSIYTYAFNLSSSLSGTVNLPGTAPAQAGREVHMCVKSQLGASRRAALNIIKDASGLNGIGMKNELSATDYSKYCL